MSRNPTRHRGQCTLIALGAVVMAATSFVAVPLAAGKSRATVRNPADALLDRARAAINRYEFQATVRLWWRDDAGPHTQIVDVVSDDGWLRLADGRVLEDGGRSWMRANQQWTTLWSDAGDPHAPALTRKYSVLTHRGPRVVERPTRELVIRRHGRVVERIAIDESLGLVVRTDRLSSTGRLISRAEFVALADVRARGDELDMSGPDGDAPSSSLTRSAGSSRDRRMLGDGFVLVGTHQRQNETQGRYSDGVFEVSVFTRSGELDWSALPDGGRDVRYGSVRARRYQTGSGTVIVWQTRGRVMTCVTDAIAADQESIIEDLARDDESTWTGVVRFVTSPFQWN